MNIPDSCGQQVHQNKAKCQAHEKCFSFSVSEEEKGDASFAENMYAGMGFTADRLQFKKARQTDIHLTSTVLLFNLE